MRMPDTRGRTTRAPTASARWPVPGRASPPRRRVGRRGMRLAVGGRMRRAVRCLPLIGVLIVMACAAPEPERASRQQCEVLRAHAIELQIGLARQYGVEGVALDAHRKALQR